MKTLIKKNFYYENNFAGEIEAKRRAPYQGGRGMHYMGDNSPATASITMINIGSLGSALAGMGEMYLQGYYYTGGMSTGQYNVQSKSAPSSQGQMEYKSFTSTADAVFFGNKKE